MPEDFVTFFSSKHLSYSCLLKPLSIVLVKDAHIITE